MDYIKGIWGETPRPLNYLTQTDNLIKTNHKENTMKFVVIGADAAGMSAASRAKRSRPDLDVTVLEKTLDVSYSA